MGGNRLLDSLDPSPRQAVLSAAREVSRPQGSVIYEQGRPMTEVHFPLRGVYSVILRLEDGGQIEALTIGREGMLGSAAFLRGECSPFDTVTQIEGVTATLALPSLLRLAGSHAELDFLLRRYVIFEQRHVHQSAACNALHLIEQRLARWLLMSQDRTGSDRLPLTQEYLAAMLGIRRQSVGEVARQLQRSGMIRYHRGAIDILDRAALERHSCECYTAVRRFYDEITPPVSGASQRPLGHRRPA